MKCTRRRNVCVTELGGSWKRIGIEDAGMAESSGQYEYGR